MSRILTTAVILAGLMAIGVPAKACDSNYPWLCPPVPSIDPPESATETAKPAAKPLQISNRRAAKPAAKTAAKPVAKGGKPLAKIEPSADSNRYLATRKAAARRWAARARHAKLAAIHKLIETSDKASERAEPAESGKTAAISPPEPRPKPLLLRVRSADGSNNSSTGFAELWAERGTPTPTPLAAAPAPTSAAPAVDAVASPAPAEPPSVKATNATVDVSSQTVAAGDTGDAAASDPGANDPAAKDSASPPSAPVAAQGEANELDLASGDPPAPSGNSSWLRVVFLAFGGLLAVGSALRLFI